MKNFEIILRVEAEKDLIDIQGYYDQVYEKIIKKSFHTLNFIEQDPKLFQERYRGIRIAPLYKFSLGIHYIESDKKIIIFRVLHTKRYFK